MFQVEWKPYDRQEVKDLNVPACVAQDEELWRSECPLILYYVVEYHQPNRVSKQFGKKQEFPIQPPPSQRLHE